MQTHSRIFLTACLVEAGLGLLAIGLNWIFNQPLLSHLQWNITPAAKGAIAAIPPLAFFVWALTTPWKPLLEISHFLDRVVRKLFQNWNIAQLFIISLLAGLGEELLFRGAIQSNLIPSIGTIPAIAVGSLLFGLCHSVTRTYVVITTIMGVYLGLLHVATGSLLVPVVTHTLYDFLALVYFLRLHPPTPSLPRPS